ncbi:hypothetical protein [Occallatibacter riparius]|uniref:Uncharacterized protein n=1 Tax=Occallatibacter riparius TaxID=1002689 RepID=A0A9J7BQ71_9BACT|nr:hypothetical protein [Occallatibacter riparius]UWZ83253.1 hypothetical protein MOP44_22120 [Occallatibacter riparius]
MNFRCFFLAVSFLVVVVPVPAQPSPRWPRADRCFHEPSQGHPYSAEFLLTSVQLLPTGDLTKHMVKEFQALDSRGRFFHGSDFPPSGPRAQSLPVLVSGHICDPEAATQTMWSSWDKRTIVLHLPARAERLGCWKSDDGVFTLNFETSSHPVGGPNPGDSDPVVASEPESPSVVTEELGTTQIQGLEAKGYYSSWRAFGDGQGEPPYLNEEHWVVPSLNLWVSQEVEYPRKANWTVRWSRELVSINDSEPETYMFQPPSTYPVTMEMMRQVSCKDLEGPKPPESPHLK